MIKILMRMRIVIVMMQKLQGRPCDGEDEVEKEEKASLIEAGQPPSKSQRLFTLNKLTKVTMIETMTMIMTMMIPGEDWGEDRVSSCVECHHHPVGHPPTLRDKMRRRKRRSRSWW